MRPRIVAFLNEALGVDLFQWIVPYPAFVYALTMAVCLVVFVRRCRSVGLDPYHALGATVTAMLGGLLGARLLWVVMNVDQWAAVPRALIQVSGATISWGAYLGGALGFIGYLALRRRPVLAHVDVLGSVFGLGPFIGRWACFLNGDDFGTLSEVPWAVVYPHGSMAFAHQVRHGLIDPLAEVSLPTHPVQLYLSLNALLLFALFTWLWRRFRFPPGTIFLGYWAVYAATRFALEYFRGDARTLYLDRFTPGQMGAIVVFAMALPTALALWWRSRRSASR